MNTTTVVRKRVEITLPTESYNMLKEASDNYGVTVKNFVAMCVMERVTDVLQKLQTVRQNSISLSEDEWSQLQHLLRHPEAFQDARQRLEKMAEDVAIDVQV